MNLYRCDNFSARLGLHLAHVLRLQTAIDRDQRVAVSVVACQRPLASMYIQKYAEGRLFSWDERQSEAKLADRGYAKERIAHEEAVEARDSEPRPRGP